jgi:peptidoglycan-associated lipoprotein
MEKFTRSIPIIAIWGLLFLLSCAGKKGSPSAEAGKTSESSMEESVSPEQGGQEGFQPGEAGYSAAAGMLERVYFDFDDANLRTDARETLKKDADVLKKNPSMKIQIEGNCDERGSAEYNLALGEKRAESIKKYLTTLGISASRLSTISYGEEKPLMLGHNEEAWSKNRRGELTPQ